MSKHVTRERDDRFTQRLNHAWFTNGLIESYTMKVDDEFQRERLCKDMEHVIDERIDLFLEGPLSGYMHEGDDDAVEELILRCVYEAYEKMVINPPGLFRIMHDDRRREMLALKWDVDHFLDTISEWAADADGLLDRFEYLDQTSDTMQLITQNYVNMMIKQCTGLTKQEQAETIRDLRIQNTLR